MLQLKHGTKIIRVSISCVTSSIVIHILSISIQLFPFHSIYYMSTMSPRAIDDEVMTGWKKKIYKLGSLQFFWLWINYMIRYLFIIFMSLVSRFSEPFSVIYMERFLLYFLPFITLVSSYLFQLCSISSISRIEWDHSYSFLLNSYIAETTHRFYIPSNEIITRRDEGSQ